MTSAPKSEREVPLKQYVSDWARIIYDATGDQTKVDRTTEHLPMLRANLRQHG